MGLPRNAYYVLTKAEASLPNSQVHPNTGAPDYDVLHNVSDLVGDTDDLTEGTTNLYYTDARVETIGDTLYLKLDGSNANTDIDIGTYGLTSAFLKATGSGLIWSDGTTGTTPAAGAGKRLMWIPAKTAFRVGEVTGTEWDDANIGLRSIALGYDTIADSTDSIAIGREAESTDRRTIAIGYGAAASNDDGVAVGRGSVASGTRSVAIGYASTASGATSVALGDSTASGSSALSMGVNATASGDDCIAMGEGAVAGPAANAIAIGNNFTNNVASTIGMGFGAKDFTISATELTWNGTAKLGDGGTTNYVEVDATGDVVFVGGAGLAYGDLYGIDETITCTNEDTWYQITFDTAGPSNDTTVSTANNDITILKAGAYKIGLTVCCHSAVAHDFEVIVKKNNGTADIVCTHLFQSTAVANQVENISGNCIDSLAATDTIETWVQCTDAAGIDFVIDHCDLNVTQIGGT